MIELPEHAFLSAYPNASLPAYTDGKFHYEGDADYFGNLLLRFEIKVSGCSAAAVVQHQNISVRLLQN